MPDSGPKSPPTRRVMDALTALATTPDGLSSAELSRRCGMTTSTTSLLLTELERDNWVARREDRRYVLGGGLFGVVHGLRKHFPLLDRGREALTELHEALGAGCSMSRIDERHLTTVDAVGHGTDGEHAVGQRFPIDPPFGLVAMAWRDADTVDRWLHGVTPRLTQTDVDAHRRVLADVRDRGYGAWRFDDAHTALHDRLASVLASLEPTSLVTRQLSTLMTMVTLTSVTSTLEDDLGTAEFVVLPIFGRGGQPAGRPEYQIEVHLGGHQTLTLDELDRALRATQARLGDDIKAL